MFAARPEVGLSVESGEVFKVPLDAILENCGFRKSGLRKLSVVASPYTTPRDTIENGR